MHYKDRNRKIAWDSLLYTLTVTEKQHSQYLIHDSLFIPFHIHTTFETLGAVFCCYLQLAQVFI